MKLITIIFTLLIITACKPVTLKNEELRGAAVTPHGFCLRLSPKAQEQQYMHGFKIDNTPDTRIIFYYYLQEYVSNVCEHANYFAVITNQTIGIDYQSAFQGKGSSYDILHIATNVDYYHLNKKLNSKKYQANAVTSISYLFDSDSKHRKYVVEALQIGINDIVKQISDDINRLKKQTK